MNAAAADVFLSYNRADAQAVGQIRSRLKDAGLITFLDRDQLPAGQSWLSALEQAIARCGAVAVLIGPAGLGTWQQREVQLALDRQAQAERAGCPFPVIPVLLPRVEDPPGGFLRLQTWVDLRSDLADPTQIHLLLTGIRGQAPAEGSAIREAVCPYRGLLAFREEDAGLFFGREKEVKELVGKLRGNKLVTLVGRSGSGKSSVVYAGLIPALRRRVDGRIWSILSLRPGPEPLHALVHLFDPPPADLPRFEADQRIEKQVDILRTKDGALGRRIRDLLAIPDEKGTNRLLLYVDQWEELYIQALYCSAPKPEQAERDVIRFIELLLDATRTAPCTVVLTVRADFYGELLKHGPLATIVSSGQVNLGPMSREGLAAAIQEPAKAVGLTVDSLLLEKLLDEVCTDLGKLPLLEYALKETWRGREGQRLTPNAYSQAGGIDGAVAKRANEIFERLSDAEQASARRLFVSLVTPGEGREDTRARAVYPEQDDAIRAVIHEFSAADARLLVTGEDAPSARRLVEISHETLIREWDLLKDWIKTNREMLRRCEHIRARMRQWEELGRNETLLLPPGLPLEEGRKLLADHGDVLIEEVQPYIAASIAADEERSRQKEAEAEVERLRGVISLAQKLKSPTSISNESVGRILDPAYDLLAKLTGGEDAPPALLRTRAAALDEFTEAYMAQGDLRAALAAAEKANNIMQKLAAADPNNAQWQRDLSVSWERLGDVRQAQGDLAGAVQVYENAQTITAKLAAADPNNAQWQRDLSVSWERLASAREDQEDRAGALEAWRAALAISERLAEAVSDGVEIHIAPVVHLAGVARMLDPTDPTTSAEAARLYDRALALLRPLAEAGQLDAEHQVWITWIEGERAAIAQDRSPSRTKPKARVCPVQQAANGGNA